MVIRVGVWVQQDDIPTSGHGHVLMSHYNERAWDDGDAKKEEAVTGRERGFCLGL
jgi:hypothetical protein